MKTFLKNTGRYIGRNVFHFKCSDFLKEHETGLYVEDYFHELVYLERRRSERSGRPFVLLLADLDSLPHEKKAENAGKSARKLTEITREVDLKGWYSHGHILGVILTETGAEGAEKVKSKFLDGLATELGPLAEGVKVSVHSFSAEGSSGRLIPDDFRLYPDLSRKKTVKKKAAIFKRAIDITGSIAGLIVFAPLFVIIPALIKLTSEGPVFYKQTRVGSLGKTFTFLKFRSMRPGSCDSIHSEYIRKLITEDTAWEGGQKKVYKISDDPRVTKIGKFLRKTSLDELPQFLNVLAGDMSLVGPRPPIPYEMECYELWHWRRVMEAKPGLTGLWQVSGRSTKSYNEMVRLDIRYIERWSPWLDLKIIFRTPLAMLSSKDAY
ncbi:undecaprenyl-phosphate galactose phosphotransferase [Anaerolineae bacterium]|nr:undecaprenyl-phosphate galactose phosphotransferase [Anaerolineae bacterium]